ncbi:hypothetical protein PVAND_015189 [Polypedilum vanderplanki]|uniref:Uncharacterized protein n=1 Tax=Polypedilum vanderplanki TaxID=319348 RepID=A0A9J6BC98_POLVA|nr:hypothetical protein PVAND_015189 [Polypedilum vanderplanki]
MENFLSLKSLIFVLFFINHNDAQVGFKYDVNKNSHICNASPEQAVFQENLYVSGIGGYNKDKHLNNITELKIERCVMHFLPHGFDEYFDNVHSLTITFTHLKNIDKEDLRQFPKLEILSITSNDLTFIKGDLFQYNFHIRAVDLRYNKIFYISEKLRNDFKQKRLMTEGNDLSGSEYYGKIVAHFDERLKCCDNQNALSNMTLEIESLKTKSEEQNKSVNLKLKSIEKNSAEIQKLQNSLKSCVNKSEVAKQNEEIRLLKVKNREQDENIKNAKEECKKDVGSNTEKLSEYQNKILLIENDIRILKAKNEDQDQKQETIDNLAKSVRNAMNSNEEQLNKSMTNIEQSLSDKNEKISEINKLLEQKASKQVLTNIEQILSEKIRQISVSNNEKFEEKASKQEFEALKKELEKFKSQVSNKNTSHNENDSQSNNLMSTIAVSSLVIINVILIVIVVTLFYKLNTKRIQEKEETKPTSQSQNATVPQESLYFDPNYDELPSTTASSLPKYEKVEGQSIYEPVYEHIGRKLPVGQKMFQNDEIPCKK